MSNVERVNAMAARARAQAEENRRKMPTVAAWTDDLKAAFGSDQIRVTYAAENGVQVGRPDTEQGIRADDMVIGPVLEKGMGRK